jgi:hypothetical protein
MLKPYHILTRLGATSSTHLLYRLLKIASLSLILTSCHIPPPPNKPQPSVPDNWSNQWSYKNTSWILPLSQWLNHPSGVITGQGIHNQSKRDWRLATKAILAACKTSTPPEWLRQQMYFYTQTPLGDNTELRHSVQTHHGLATSISASEYEKRAQHPTVITLTNQDMNDDCAAIAGYIALKRYDKPFMLDLSHNHLSNKGVAWLLQLVDSYADDHPTNIEINLKHNPRVGSLAKHYAQLNQKNHQNVRIHLDQDSAVIQAQTFAKAIGMDAHNQQTSSARRVITSHQGFSPGMQGIAQLVKLLAGHKQLEEIHLASPHAVGKLDNLAAIALAEIIRPMKKLSSLSLVNYPIGDQGMGVLLDELANNHPQFYLLNISRTQVGDATMASLTQWTRLAPLVLIISDNPGISLEAINRLALNQPSWIIIK